MEADARLTPGRIPLKMRFDYRKSITTHVVVNKLISDTILETERLPHILLQVITYDLFMRSTTPPIQ